jgi:hypothetical protein
MKKLSADFSVFRKSATPSAIINGASIVASFSKRNKLLAASIFCYTDSKAIYWFSNTATRREWYHGTI